MENNNNLSSMIILYYQTKIPISFWCKQELNPEYLIQPSETLPVELTETHFFPSFLKYQQQQKMQNE